jgi:hypothetical protein
MSRQVTASSITTSPSRRIVGNVTGFFDDLGFDPAYECAVNPEFPGRGSWSIPTCSFNQDGTGVSDASGISALAGTPVVIKVQPIAEADEWVGFFESAGWGGDRAIATPNPNRVCVVSGGGGYVVDVLDPGSSYLVPLLPVRGFVGLRDLDLVVLWSFTDAVGLNRSGVAWTSPRLGFDDLEVLGTDADGIVCRAAVSYPGELDEFHIHPETGKPVDVPRFHW